MSWLFNPYGLKEAERRVHNSAHNCTTPQENLFKSGKVQRGYGLCPEGGSQRYCKRGNLWKGAAFVGEPPDLPKAEDEELQEAWGR